MSYFPCDIPYMSEEELEENGIKIPKDDKFETYWNTVEKATELADKLKMEIAEANEWDTALAIVDEELRPILAGLQLIDMKDEARKGRLKELAEKRMESHVRVLISQQEAIDAIMGEYPEVHYPDWYAHIIKQLPPAQPPEYVTGFWLIRRWGDDAKCSNCGKTFKDVYDMESYDGFCRHCGAKMKGIKVTK